MAVNLSSTEEYHILEKTMDLSQAAGDYDLFTATGDVWIEKMVMYVSTAGATFTSVTVQTDDTSSLELLSSVEGAVAEILEGRNLKAITTPFRLSSAKKVQYTIDGSTGVGAIKVSVVYRKISAGSYIS